VVHDFTHQMFDHSLTDDLSVSESGATGETKVGNRALTGKPCTIANSSDKIIIYYVSNKPLGSVSAVCKAGSWAPPDPEINGQLTRLEDLWGPIRAAADPVPDADEGAL